jgi:hypothetical protein
MSQWWNGNWIQIRLLRDSNRGPSVLKAGTKTTHFYLPRHVYLIKGPPEMYLSRVGSGTFFSEMVTLNSPKLLRPYRFCGARESPTFYVLSWCNLLHTSVHKQFCQLYKNTYGPPWQKDIIPLRSSKEKKKVHCLHHSTVYIEIQNPTINFLY